MSERREPRFVAELRHGVLLGPEPRGSARRQARLAMARNGVQARRSDLISGSGNLGRAVRRSEEICGGGGSKFRNTVSCYFACQVSCYFPCCRLQAGTREPGGMQQLHFVV